MAVNFFDNCTVWPRTFKFIRKKFDNCTVWLFDNCTVRLFDNCTVVFFDNFPVPPPEGLRAPELPGVNPGGRPQESGGDSKAI